MSDAPSKSGSSNQLRTIDAACEALSNVHRYRLLTTLLEQNPNEAIDPPIPEDGESDIGSVQIAMYHTQLPKLDRAGFIAWNRDENQVSRGPEFGMIKELLEPLDGCDDGT